jgi:sugar lactone lactonase YvrE
MITGLRVALHVGLVTLLCTAAAAPPNAPEQFETVALFDATQLETPENIAIDNDNNKYISLALTGEIRKIAPDGTQSTLAELPLGAPPLTFCGSFFAGLTGITLDVHDNLYANLASCDPDSRGVWKIPRAGQPERIAALPLAALPNGIVHHHDYVYVADSALGVVWRVSDEGGTAELWASGAELAPEPNGLPGPNGLKLFKGELYVSNPSQSTIVAIGVEPDGSAGASRIHTSGVFCDDFAFDVHGRLYCGTDPFDTLLRIAPDGSVETLLTAVDGLDGPTAVAFGHRGDRFELYVTNAAFPFFPVPPPRRPSLMRVALDVPGFEQP